jgi:hypothetical protein
MMKKGVPSFVWLEGGGGGGKCMQTGTVGRMFQWSLSVYVIYI